MTSVRFRHMCCLFNPNTQHERSVVSHLISSCWSHPPQPISLYFSSIIACCGCCVCFLLRFSTLVVLNVKNLHGETLLSSPMQCDRFSPTAAPSTGYGYQAPSFNYHEFQCSLKLHNQYLNIYLYSCCFYMHYMCCLNPTFSCKALL